MKNNKKPVPIDVTCKSCTLQLVMRCYEKKWWFRFFREPMVFGMRVFSFYHGIDPFDYPVKENRCKGCVRFMKVALKKVSPTFRYLNGRINPIFNTVRNRQLTPEEMDAAKAFARKAMG